MSKILIVAGHGAGDSGAIGVNGVKEADLTRDFAIKIFEKTRNSLDIELFDTNKNLRKYRQKNKFDFSKYGLIFEIHFNSFNGAAFGTEVEIKKGKGVKQIDKDVLSIFENLGFKNRGITFRDDLSNLNGAAAQNVPYLYLETCFIDNKNDFKRFSENFNSICSKVANALIKIYREKETYIELTEINDIVWEYAHRGIITESEKWKRKAEQDGDIYWLLRKNLNFIRRKGF